MTRKDYIVIAAILQSSRVLNTGDNSGLVEHFIGNIENGLVAHFECDNPRFDEDKFRAAARLREMS